MPLYQLKNRSYHQLRTDLKEKQRKRKQDNNAALFGVLFVFAMVVYAVACTPLPV